MDNLRIKKETKKTQAPRIPAREIRQRQSLCGSRGKPLKARCLGEHLECSPCGMLGGCACVSRWPGPEVLLSLLPINPKLYQEQEISRRAAHFCLQGVTFLFQCAVALERTRVLGCLRDQRLLLFLDVVDQHAVEQVAQLQA